MAEKYMNPREAIIELNRLKTGVRTPTDFDRRDRAIETAKAALQKQIQKAPKPEGQDEMDWLLCPSCHNIVGTVDNYCAMNKSNKYCNKCGQALDWSEE